MIKKIKTADYFSTQRRIKALRRHIINKSPPNDFIPALRMIFKGLSLAGTTLENTFIYRSRLNEHGKLFKHIDELKYPPKKCIIKKGRFNDVKESVLYASLCELGTIIESQPSLDKLFTIIKIKKIDNLPLFFFPSSCRKATIQSRA